MECQYIDRRVDSIQKVINYRNSLIEQNENVALNL